MNTATDIVGYRGQAPGNNLCTDCATQVNLPKHSPIYAHDLPCKCSKCGKVISIGDAFYGQKPGGVIRLTGH